MSRIGKRFIEVPEKVTIKLDGQKISVDGPKGNLSRILPSLVCCTLNDDNQKLFIEEEIMSDRVDIIAGIKISFLCLNNRYDNTITDKLNATFMPIKRGM